MKLKALAKINLFLEVKGRRGDGYHEIETLFAKIDLCDEVTVRAWARPGVSLTLINRSGTRVPSGPRNLAVKAARTYLRRFAIPGGVEIRLVKRIPAGGGLGGGSSDAGAVLRALAVLFPGPGRRRALPALAAGLGADVPLFIREGGLFIGRGIGDRLTPAPARRPLPPVVLVCPRASVPTARAYARRASLRRRNALTRGPQLGRLLKALADGSPPSQWTKLLFNRLEDAVLPFYPFVARARRALASLGAAPLMSGSGSSVFAFASGAAEAARWTSRLRREGWPARTVRCLD